jgi:hypothetical protein
MGFNLSSTLFRNDFGASISVRGNSGTFGSHSSFRLESDRVVLLIFLLAYLDLKRVDELDIRCGSETCHTCQMENLDVEPHNRIVVDLVLVSDGVNSFGPLHHNNKYSGNEQNMGNRKVLD